ncbi:hypothetical protein PIB30_031617 [Stylosanthes scabra]|uniref:Uncharacterized protein n=1 Tax=Stylosanthes scabra TaxID=79078 RepID=A0ABU6UD40_9FABA|nr:hypothetical protein [Stylosanthes scabra]
MRRSRSRGLGFHWGFLKCIGSDHAAGTISKGVALFMEGVSVADDGGACDGYAFTYATEPPRGCLPLCVSPIGGWVTVDGAVVVMLLVAAEGGCGSVLGCLRWMEEFSRPRTLRMSSSWFSVLGRERNTSTSTRIFSVALIFKEPRGVDLQGHSDAQIK